MNRDYYWEYVQFIDRLILDFIEIIKQNNSDAFDIGSISLIKSVRSNLSIKLTLSDFYKEKYNNIRNKNEGDKKIYEEILNKLLNEYNTNSFTNTDLNNKCINNNSVYKNLEKYKNRILFYCINSRQLNYLLPILNTLKRDIILLTTFEISDNTIIPDNVIVFEWLYYIDISCINNKYLLKNFPTIYYDANDMMLLINIILPSAIFVLEGCHEDMETIACIGKSFLIPTICIQQGWPSYIYTRFKDMSYDYFLTWGKKFNYLWKLHNKKVKFIDIGYLYNIISEKTKNGITFFLHEPVLIMNDKHFEQLIEFCVFCADSFKQRMIYVREHPEFPLLEKYKSTLETYKNIEFHNNTPLNVLYSMTSISVSIFSSTIMESLFHNCIPFVFNPTSSPEYKPNLAKEEIGVFTKSLKSAKSKMTKLNMDKEAETKLINKIETIKSKYLTDTELDTIKNIDIFLRQIEIN